MSIFDFMIPKVVHAKAIEAKSMEAKGSEVSVAAYKAKLAAHGHSADHSIIGEAKGAVIPKMVEKMTVSTMVPKMTLSKLDAGIGIGKAATASEKHHVAAKATGTTGYSHQVGSKMVHRFSAKAATAETATKSGNESGGKTEQTTTEHSHQHTEKSSDNSISVEAGKTSDPVKAGSPANEKTTTTTDVDKTTTTTRTTK
ncbi:hypothetical protein SAE02_61700 [Skermanella aerolata]|uniref:Uncharacterized protein n=1 Tax=Skermanella aerolata TaxID=393310 RepID=A0A512DZZ5_9PROT|nr:hypothetical protein [Skermanella aerolata]KJB91871.1 hypothetical protein N826_25480 [Skermanella aerolata KACC 11604]GEO42022.1 hypothetical protein SAE02_61700 [Skermanella aerolata]